MGYSISSSTRDASSPMVFMTMTSRTGTSGVELVLDHGSESDHLHGAAPKLLEGGVGCDVALELVGGLGECGDLLEDLLVHDGFLSVRCDA